MTSSARPGARSRARKALRLATLLALAALTVGCSTTGGGEADPTPTTARLTGDGGPPGDVDLLELDDVADAPHMPAGLRPVDASDLPLFENPDPRAPCGASLSLPSPSNSPQVVFVADGPPALQLYEFVLDLELGEASKLVRVFTRDMRPGCPGFESETHIGASQRNVFLRAVDLPRLGDDRVAAITRVQLAGSPPVFAATVLVRSGGSLVLLGVVSPKDIPDELVRHVADAAADGL